MKFSRLGLILFVVLIALIVWAGFMVQEFVDAKVPEIESVKKVAVTRSKIVAARELPAFTLIKKEDLQPLKGTADSSEPDVGKFMNRYLLVSIKKAGEVKDENLAPEAATPVLDDAVAVSIPASATTSPGGQLSVGEVVELIAVDSKENKPVQRFDKLMVLNVAPGNKEANLPGTITLAVPASQRDQFATAIVATQLVITRKIDVHK